MIAKNVYVLSDILILEFFAPLYCIFWPLLRHTDILCKLASFSLCMRSPLITLRSNY